MPSVMSMFVSCFKPCEEALLNVHTSCCTAAGTSAQPCSNCTDGTPAHCRHTAAAVLHMMNVPFFMANLLDVFREVGHKMLRRRSKVVRAADCITSCSVPQACDAVQ